MVNGLTKQFRFTLTDNLGGVSHSATGSNASPAFPGYTYGSNRSVTWTSSNTNVATVDGNGRVTAKANGTTNIKVSFKWTEAGTQYELTTQMTLTVKVPDYTYTNTDYTASAYVATKAISNGGTYIITDSSGVEDGREGMVQGMHTVKMNGSDIAFNSNSSYLSLIHI